MTVTAEVMDDAGGRMDQPPSRILRWVGEDAERAAATGHSTARGAAEIASEAGVKMLALVHLSPRYMVREVRAEAESAFENTVVPRDFDLVRLPVAEKGEPELVRWEAGEHESAPT